jgi:hypothetical protein
VPFGLHSLLSKGPRGQRLIWLSLSSLFILATTLVYLTSCIPHIVKY